MKRLARPMRKKAEKVVKNESSSLELHRVFMAALRWARDEVTDESFAETVLSASEKLIQMSKVCGCENGFDPNGDINEVIDD